MPVHRRFHFQPQFLLSLYLCTSCLCYAFVIVVQYREEGLDGWWSGQVIGCTVITIMVTPPAKAPGQETMHTSLYEKVCAPLPLHNFLAYCIVLVISFDKNIPPQLALMIHTYAVCVYTCGKLWQVLQIICIICTPIAHTTWVGVVEANPRLSFQAVSWARGACLPHQHR